eukprot:scpid100414/ scgid22260/ 
MSLALFAMAACLVHSAWSWSDETSLAKGASCLQQRVRCTWAWAGLSDKSLSSLTDLFAFGADRVHVALQTMLSQASQLLLVFAIVDDGSGVLHFHLVSLRKP